ncbi:hypothetical protein Pogu_2118 [Pyrobaculum oguniense TE7]|uniref:Uncharacterized protein n=1 Tax=Pyrobaculum oguniense (strain DSM 13380 / JCM 10595 / TE7) TaxID=698757 RepID=H6QCU9_PYROT|nr:hypothetical protein Pogu_2118 [Pyrobaculum oguniense TE7]
MKGGTNTTRRMRKSVEMRLNAVLQYVQKAGTVELVELAKALGMHRMQVFYVAKLLDGQLCYKVVGSRALVGRTCADVEERLRKDYNNLVEVVKRRCKGSCCVKLRDVVSALIHRDPNTADVEYYRALVEIMQGDLSLFKFSGKTLVCVRG